MVDARFRGSKGNHGRKGGVLVRMKANEDKGDETGKLLQKLYWIEGLTHS